MVVYCNIQVHCLLYIKTDYYLSKLNNEVVMYITQLFFTKTEKSLATYIPCVLQASSIQFYQYTLRRNSNYSMYIQWVNNNPQTKNKVVNKFTYFVINLMAHSFSRDLYSYI